MKTVWSITKKLGWPWSVIVGGIIGSGYVTDLAVNPGTDYTIFFHVMEAGETREKRLADRKAVENFCLWLDDRQNYDWGIEAKKQLGMCE